MFALSDPFKERCSGECCHNHNQACPECKGILDVLKAIEDTLRNGDLDLSEKQKILQYVGDCLCDVCLELVNIGKLCWL